MRRLSAREVVRYVWEMEKNGDRVDEHNWTYLRGDWSVSEEMRGDDCPVGVCD